MSRRYFLAEIPGATLYELDPFAGSGALASASGPLSGSPWDTIGAGADFQIVSGAAERTAVSDATTGVQGRIDYLANLNLATTQVRVEMTTSNTLETSGMGAACRVKADGSFVRALYYTSADVILVEKRTGAGAIAGLGEFAGPSVPAGNPVMQFAVDDAGRFYVWVYALGTVPAAPFTGSHADLATGGALATGSPGIADYRYDSAVVTRRYDNVKVTQPNLGAMIGEVKDAISKEVRPRLNGAETGRFRVGIDNSVIPEIMNRDGEVLLLVYPEGSDDPEFAGELADLSVEAEEDGTLSLECAFDGAPMIRLQKTLIGKTPPGSAYSPYAASKPFDQILFDLLAVANAESDTNIRAGAMSVLPTAVVGPASFKPFWELLTEAQASKVPYPIHDPSSYLIRDDMTGSGSLDGRTATPGPGTCDTGGAANDWTVTGGMVRRSGSENARWAVYAHAAQASIVGGFTYRASARAQVGQQTYLTFFVRLSGHDVNTPGSGNWLSVGVTFNSAGGTVSLSKKIGTTTTQLGSYSFQDPAFIGANELYTVIVLADDSGAYAVWHNSQGVVPAAPLISGIDADLETGGPLDDGTAIAVMDSNLGGAITRDVDNVYAAPYTGPVGFDFDFVYCEPTIDALGVKIADLVITSPKIGVDRPNVVLEFSAEGNRSVKNFKYLLNRRGQLNQAWSLPTAEAVAGQPLDVRRFKDDASINDLGLREEVIPSDLQSSAFREALLAAHVDRRKGARKMLSLTPSAEGPRYGVDYTKGDTVTARAEPFGQPLFNGTVRVRGADIATDDLDKEDVTPILLDE